MPSFKYYDTVCEVVEQGADSHCIYLANIDDDMAITNIRIGPAGRIKGAQVCTYEVVSSTPDTVFIKHNVIEKSFLHKFLGQSIEFNCTSFGNMLPGPVINEYAYFLDIDCDERVFIEYDIVEVRKKASKKRYVNAYKEEVFMDCGKSTPGMLKYTIPVRFEGGEGSCVNKLFAFVPDDTTSVDLFFGDDTHGCPFVRHMTNGGKLYYTFDLCEGANSVSDAVVIVRCSGDAGADAVDMGLVGTQDRMLCFSAMV